MKTKIKKNLNGSDSSNDEKSSNSNLLISVLAILGLGGAATWFFFNKKGFSFDPSSVKDYSNRTPDQIVAEAKEISDMYAMHGQSLTSDALIKAVQQFFDLEKSLGDSHAALKQIETGLAAKSGKGLIYGHQEGFYGLNGFNGKVQLGMFRN